jgi:hypothetical protein
LTKADKADRLKLKNPDRCLQVGNISVMKGETAMNMIMQAFFILLLFATPVLAEKEVSVFTDQDLEKYGGSMSSGPETSMQNNKSGNSRSSVSPLESDLRRRKDEVAQENRDYIEEQYQWMMADCQKYEGEFKKDCLFRTEEWRKEQLQQVETLKEYLSK